MSELSRSLLNAAREGLSPDSAAMARVRAKVAASVAAPAATTATATTATATTHAAAVGLAVKLGALLVVIGAVATTAIVAGRSHRAAPDVPKLMVTPTEPDEVRNEIRVATPDDPPLAHKAVPPPARVAAPAPVATPGVVPPAGPPVVTPEPATLSREVELIDLAMVSLRKAAPRAALEAIAVFQRETFGHGQMAEEAAAIEIEAYCRLHEDVSSRVADFDRKWPSSAQRERIQTACFARS